MIMRVCVWSQAIKEKGRRDEQTSCNCAPLNQNLSQQFHHYVHWSHYSPVCNQWWGWPHCDPGESKSCSSRACAAREGWAEKAGEGRVEGMGVGHICIHIYAKRSIQIYILIFSLIFLSEIVCSTIRLCIQIFVYFSEIFFFYYSHKNHVDVWHGTSNLLLLRCHVPACHVESNSKRLLMTSQAATRHMQLKPLYWLSLLFAWPYTEEVRINLIHYIL